MTAVNDVLDPWLVEGGANAMDEETMVRAATTAADFIVTLGIDTKHFLTCEARRRRDLCFNQGQRERRTSGQS